ncbi:hypothetical protein KM043_005116 [Ampulex compressa]|nr:hypothetical protein KM043_005116 [Ampulex compressa]
MLHGSTGKNGDTYQNSLDETTRSGPYFDKSASKNVTALLGKTTYLNCRVKNLGNKTGNPTYINTRSKRWARLEATAARDRGPLWNPRDERRTSLHKKPESFVAPLEACNELPKEPGEPWAEISSVTIRRGASKAQVWPLLTPRPRKAPQITGKAR